MKLQDMSLILINTPLKSNLTLEITLFYSVFIDTDDPLAANININNLICAEIQVSLSKIHESVQFGLSTAC